MGRSGFPAGVTVYMILQTLYMIEIGNEAWGIVACIGLSGISTWNAVSSWDRDGKKAANQ